MLRTLKGFQGLNATHVTLLTQPPQALRAMLVATVAKGVVAAPITPSAAGKAAPAYSMDVPAQNPPGPEVFIAMKSPPYWSTWLAPNFPIAIPALGASVLKRDCPDRPGIACCALNVLAMNPPKFP